MERRKDAFFAEMERQRDAVTFDEVLLKTGYSTIELPKISLVGRFSRNCPLKRPFVSAAMDTVTGYRMAIAMARLGGIGVIHRNMSPKKQAWHVARVKNHLNVRIADPPPVCVRDTATVEEVLNERRRKRYPFESFLVVDENGKLVGVITGQDFDFCVDKTRQVRTAMTPRSDLEVASPEISDDEAFEAMVRMKKKRLPLENEDGTVAGLFVFSDLVRARSGTNMHNTDERGNLRVAAAIGVGDGVLEHVELLLNERVDVVVVDTAHGDSERVLKAVRRVKMEFPMLDVVAGNVSEGDSARRLIEDGRADGVKVGQGPGSICSTRTVTGTGCPQMTAIHQCELAVRDSGVPVCADGGISTPAHVTLALAAGAESVMMGRMFAGTKETPGETLFRQGQRVKVYRGMGSRSAMRDSRASRERYSQSDKFAPEGVEAVVPYQGSVSEVVGNLEGWLRSSLGYVGASSIPELHEKADFRRISSEGRKESDPHDVTVTPEAVSSAAMDLSDDEAFDDEGFLDENDAADWYQ
ncbi:MAG: IMP dehydrogenase [Parcubacteria group bacterium]|nr:IMP dehydrogenase [Parcubacteria group bacterium]